MSAETDAKDEIVSRLERITTGNGYNNTIVSASWKTFKMPKEVQHRPVVYVIEDTSNIPQMEIGQVLHVDASLVLWGYVKSTAGDVPEIANLFYEDIKNALYTNRSTLGFDPSLNNTVAGMMITSKDTLGALISPERIVEVSLRLRYHDSITAQ